MAMSTEGKVAIGLGIAGALGGIAAAVAGALGSKKPVQNRGGGMNGTRATNPTNKVRGSLVGGCGCGR